MTEINAALVKSLREATGMGMMECKKALVECEGDFDKARDLLRVKSGAKADKVAGRKAGEGRVAFAQSADGGALVEINCETDFVARDEHIAQFADSVAAAVAAADTVGDDISSLALADGTGIEAARQALVMKLGENISVSRHKKLTGQVHHYIHHGSKIAAICTVSGIDDELAHGICMHIAAMRPRYIRAEDVPADVLAHEKTIYAAQAEETGKPADIAAKIADGKVKKFLSDNSLHGQPYIKDSDKTVGELIAAAGGSVDDFALLIVGEDGDTA